jgi:hypothetical protein
MENALENLILRNLLDDFVGGKMAILLHKTAMAVE